MAMNAEISEMSKHDFLFSYSCFRHLLYYNSGSISCVIVAVCFWIFAGPWVFLMPVKRSICLQCVPARLTGPADIFHSAQNQYYPSPLPSHRWNTGVCAFKAVRRLSEIETLFPVLYKSNWFHCNIVYCVFSRMSEIPGNDFSLSASRTYLEA